MMGKNRMLYVLILLNPLLWGSDTPARGESDLVFGMSTVLSGPAQALGLDMRKGVLTGFERINRAGGINGRRLRLMALDDGYEPSRTAPNMRQLIEKEKVLGIIGNVGTPTAIVSLPIAKENKTLFFAGYTGAGVLRKEPVERYVINYRASYAEEAGAMINALLDELKLQPEDIALFTQRDAYGDAGFNGSIAALKRHGLKEERSILHVRYERNTLAVENAVADVVLAEHPVRAVVMVGAYAPCAKFIQLCSQADLHPIFLNVSFVGSKPLARELLNTNETVIVTQVVPHPLDDKLPIVRDYLADLNAFEPGATPSFGDLEGYIASRILTLALEKVSGETTRESLVNALEGLGEFELGLGTGMRLYSTEHQASHTVWPTILKSGSFVPFAWKNLVKSHERSASRE